MAKLIGVKEMEAKVEAFFKEKLADKESLTDLGELTRDRIYDTVKLGYSMVGGAKNKLQGLSEGYKKYRRKYQTIYKTGKFFSPSRSNLTFTGQMLEALTYKINVAQKKFGVFVEDSQRAPTNKLSLLKIAKAQLNKKSRKKAKKALESRSGRQEESMTNAEVAAEVASNGRPFLGLDDKSVERLRNEIIKDLRTKLRLSGLRK